VGLLLGSFEGWMEPEGTDDGSCDGSKVDDGETLGIEVGEVVGLAVGCFVGFC
jgi:hypothetical protein